MKAMLLKRVGPMKPDADPLSYEDVPDPDPSAGEVLIRVRACGVCHTELDEIEGRLTPPRLPVIPGHEVVGKIVSTGAGVPTDRKGERVGVGWIYSSTGKSDENLSPQFQGTGCDANGGYAELMVVPAAYAHPIPGSLGDAETAPLLCAGAVGYRSLRMARLQDGDALGLTGFGGSAHLVLQVARNQFPNSPIYVFARSPESRDFAIRLGATWAGDTNDIPPGPLRSIIDTTPAWTPVVAALRNLQPGGRLVINAIRKESDDQQALLTLSYHEHLWREREIQSVANVTAADIRDFLAIAGDIGIHPTIETYRLDEANRALRELKFGSVRGAKVLQVGP